MAITLQQFEQIDGLYASILRMGDFETCADPRAWISASNRLLDACIDAVGFEKAMNGYASAEECAADITTRALLSADFVVDEEAFA